MKTKSRNKVSWIVLLSLLLAVFALMFTVPYEAQATSTSCGSITDIKIYDLDSGQTYATVTNNGSLTIDLSQSPDNFNIEVVTTGAVESVDAYFEGGSSRVENAAPYRFPSGDHNAWNPAVGTYTFIAKAYNQNRASGTRCDTDTFHLTVIDSGTPGGEDCPVCVHGVKEMTIKLEDRASNGDSGEQVRARVGGLGGQILFDTHNDDNPYGHGGIYEGESFTIDVDPGDEIVLTVQGNSHRHETIKAQFTADCSLYVGKTSGNSYIMFKVTHITLDNEDGGLCTPPLDPPPPPVCADGHLLWVNNVDVNNLSGGNGIPQADVRMIRNGTTQYSIPNIPAALDQPININISEAIAWDGYLTRPNTSDQPNERFKLVFLNKDFVVYESAWTGESDNDGIDTGVVSDDWTGSLGNALIPSGVDEIIIVHWSDSQYGEGDTSSANSVVPSSVCIEYTPTLLSVGDTVWFDANADGIQDNNADEAGIDGVEVQLLSNGAVVDTDVTKNGGLYLFEGLKAGTYQIVIPAEQDGAGKPLEGLINTIGDADPDDSSADDDDNGVIAADGSVESAEFALVYNGEPTTEDGDANSDLTIDFGFHTLHSIGSTAFSDDDNSGTQEVGEEGIADLVVELLDGNGVPVLDDNGRAITTTTDTNGDYYFGELFPGDYQVRVTPSDDAPVSSTPTSTTDDDVDGDDNGIQAGSGDPATSPVITLAPDSEPVAEPAQGGNQDAADDNNGNMTIDFGFVPLVSIGSTVFLDWNNNGRQDTDIVANVLEIGLENIVIELLDSDEVPVLNGNGDPIRMTTNIDGNYYFGDLLPGDYIVRVTPPTSYPYSSVPTTALDNDIDGDDNGIQTGGRNAPTLSPIITLTVNDEPVEGSSESGEGEFFQGSDQDDADDASGNMTVDFGFVPESIIIGD